MPEVTAFSEPPRTTAGLACRLEPELRRVPNYAAAITNHGAKTNPSPVASVHQVNVFRLGETLVERHDRERQRIARSLANEEVGEV